MSKISKIHRKFERAFSEKYNGNEPFKVTEIAKKIQELMPCGSPHSCEDCIHSFMATSPCSHLKKIESELIQQEDHK